MESGHLEASLADQQKAHLTAQRHAGATLLFYDEFLPRWHGEGHFSLVARWLAKQHPERQALMFRLLAHHYRERAGQEQDKKIAAGLRVLAASHWEDAVEFDGMAEDEAKRFWTRLAEAFPPEVQPSPVVIQAGAALNWVTTQDLDKQLAKEHRGWAALEANAAGYEEVVS